MLGLNETAALRRCIGQRGGKPAYAEPGAPFACRSEAAARRGAGSNSAERRDELRLFMEDADVRPGDRIELGGQSFRVAEVKRLRGRAGVHHLEISAKAGER